MYQVTANYFSLSKHVSPTIFVSLMFLLDIVYSTKFKYFYNCCFYSDSLVFNTIIGIFRHVFELSYHYSIEAMLFL
jgi:hypothetical protein